MPERSRRSHSAEGAAVLRAAGAREPDPRLRNPDHLAERFLSVWAAALVKVPLLRHTALHVVDRLLPGLYRHISLRTRYFDAVLLGEVVSGVRQVVILGAGADSRPYRFAEHLRGVRVFEVDQPATSAWKMARVRQMYGELPGHVRYVGLDFQEESLEAAFDRVAMRDDVPTLFLCEGVTPYLNAKAVDTTLATVARFHVGSSIVFDYMHLDAVSDPARFPHAAKYHRYVRRHGEPLTFGLDPREVAEFLAARNLVLLTDAYRNGLVRPDLGGLARQFIGAEGLLPFAGIVHAAVPRPVLHAGPRTRARVAAAPGGSLSARWWGS